MYGRYRETLNATVHDASPIEYDWGALPKTLDIAWMAYGSMFDEFAREIANSLNDLNGYSIRLKAWQKVIAGLSIEEKFEATHEFIDPIATIGLNLPYVIRSRFLFAAAHLSHQANRSRLGDAWHDEFPLDNEINFADADRFGSPWRRYNALKKRLERIGGSDYRLATRDFRNAYNHRFSSRFVVGITQTVTRQKDPSTGSVAYSYGGREAFELGFVTGVMDDQYRRGQKAFMAFQSLVREHEGSIRAAITRAP